MLEEKFKKAQEAFERRRRSEAREIVSDAVRNFEGKMSAYIMANYNHLIDMTVFHWNSDNEKLKDVKLMSESEFEERIANIEKQIAKRVGTHTQSFKSEARKVFDEYAENKIDVEELKIRLTQIEERNPLVYIINPKFKDEIFKVLNGYFWGRDSITSDFLERYEEHIHLCCKTITAQEANRNIENSSELMTDEEKQLIFEITLGYSKKVKVTYD